MPYQLSEEQRMMRDSCRAFADEVITPFIRDNWRREWDMNAGERLPREILEAADKVGIRTLGIPEEFGGMELDPKTEVQTFAIIAEEIARGDCGLADKLVREQVSSDSEQANQHHANRGVAHVNRENDGYDDNGDG